MTNFTMLELTNLNPDSLEDEDITGSVQHKWEMSVFEGAWIRGSTAGGCRNNLRKIHACILLVGKGNGMGCLRTRTSARLRPGEFLKQQ